MKMLAYSLLILTLTVLRDGQSKTIKESYSCRNSVTNEVCVGHQLDCEQGKEIYVLHGQYMYSKTETNCSNLPNVTCMVDNRSYCSRDYIVPVMNEVSSECNGFRSCRPPTPKGVSGLYCVKLDEFRFPTFYRLYTLSYLSYTCISDLDSTSNPNPESTPYPNTKQTPNHESSPNPNPTHNPNPTPTPYPNPTPNPESTSNPYPTPNPDPEPSPNPYPEPTANPTPTPYPNPTPDPDPTPNPNPTPNTNPTSNPNPEPSPIPYPEQSLTPYPYPESTPNPNPGSTPPTTWDPLTKSDGNKIETLFNTTGQSGNETTIKESYSWRNSVTNDVCVGHQLDCDQGQEIYVLNGRYMYSMTETNCSNLLNGICMVDNRSYCSRDYIESVMDDVLLKCNGLRSCRPPTPKGVSGLYCVKWNQFRFPTFYRLYTLSYLSYTCISAPTILNIDENIGRTKTAKSSHVVVMGDIKPNTTCSLRVDHSVHFVFIQSNKENSSLLYYSRGLRPLHIYVVRVRVKYYFKLSFHGPLTDLKINLTTIGRPTRELDVTTHCWTETVTTTSRSPNPEPGPTSEPTHNPTPYRKTTTSSPLSTSTPLTPTTSNRWGNTDGKTPQSTSNGWGYTDGRTPPSTSNGWGNTDGKTPPSTSNGWGYTDGQTPLSTSNGLGYTDGKTPLSTTEQSDNQPTAAPSLQWTTALSVGIVAFSALVIFLPVITVILRR